MTTAEETKRRDGEETPFAPGRAGLKGAAAGEDPFGVAAELTYFDRSRRQFIKLSGLALAGLVLPGAIFPSSGTAADSPDLAITEAVALALSDAGVKAVTNVPATGAVTLFDACCRAAGISPAYAFNEELAYTMAHAAALAGVRSAALIKSHGLAKAANSVIDSLTLGNTAGFVAVVLDDPQGRHSDNIFDLDAFLVGTGMPFKRADRETLYDDLLESLLWSEEVGTPVALFVDSELVGKRTAVKRRQLSSPAAAYARDPFRHVLCPPLAPYQRKVMEARLARKDWRAVPVPSLPPVPGGLPPAWRGPASRYIPVFDVFQELRPEIPLVSGDTGLSSLFAFAPYRCVDACSYFGGSLPLAVGFQMAGHRGAWAVTGDYAFIAAGHMGLIEAFSRKIPLKVLVMDNGHAMATGGQPVPPGIFDRVLSGWSPFVSRIDDPTDRPAIRATLARAVRSDRMEIVVARFRG